MDRPSLAVAVWGPRATVILFVAGVLGFNAVAAFVLDAGGGGNSGPTLFLGASIVGLLAVRSRVGPVRAAAVATLVAGVVLVATLDGHGLAVLAGLLGGAALAGRAAAPRDAGRASAS